MFLFDSAHGASSFQRRHPCACKKTTAPRRTKRRAAGLPAGRREPRRVCLLVRHNYTIFYQSCQQKKNARSFRTTFFVEIIQISLFFDNSDSANLRAHGYAAARAETIAGAAGTRRHLRRERRPKPARPARGNDCAQGRRPAVFICIRNFIHKETPARGRRTPTQEGRRKSARARGR